MRDRNLENVNRAAEEIHRSPGSLSKAVSRLVAALQTSIGIELLRTVDSNYHHAPTQFLVQSEQKAIEQVLDRETHLALITSDPPANFTSMELAKIEFSKGASKKHPLFKKYGVKPTTR